MSARLPALFLGHGSPLNALRANPWTRAWSALGAALPRPRAVLAVSAHWYVPATAVTAMATPRTIHDFGGFPRELYEVRYPAPGEATLAARVQQLRARLEAGEHAPLIDYGVVGKDALLSVPTPEHYLPLLYVLGASVAGEPVTFPVEGMDGGSVSMLAVRFG